MNTDPTVLAHLSLGRSEWPESLVPPSVHARLVAAAPKLPEPFTGLFIECHLSHPTRTDYGVRLVPSDRDEAMRSGRCPESFRPFFAAWADPAHPASRVPMVDIEYDMAEADAEPFISPALEPELMDGYHAIASRTAAERAAGKRRLPVELVRPVMRALDPTLPEEVFAQVERCAEALPACGMVIPVWPGSSRPGALPEPSIRATFAMPRDALRGYLQGFGWRGDLDRLERYLDLLTPSSPWAAIDADILPWGVGSRIGLYQQHWWVRPWDTDLSGALGRLQHYKLCVPERLAGLRAWVASQPDRPEPGRARSLSLKIVLDAGRPAVVKAYISTFDEAHAIRSPPPRPERGSQAVMTA